MERSERWLALDAVRGLTVAGMLLVNNPGGAAVYPPLEHAPWHGWTPTDQIFPFFLFIVGITTELSLNRRADAGATDAAIRRRIVRRGCLIILSGLLLAAFPYLPLTRITDVRIPGVLQRIGVCYLVSALIAWRQPTRFVAGAAAAIMLGYWALLALVAAPGQPAPTLDVPAATLPAYLDRWLLDGHLWASSKTWDPEGPLSTVSAVATSLLGILAGRWMRSSTSPAQRLNGLFAVGAMAIAIGLAWGAVFPINKSLWTSSYVLFTAGMAASTLATAAWLIESAGVAGWTGPFVVFGRNPLVAFLGSGAMARTMISLIVLDVGGEPRSLRRVIYDQVFAPWLSPINASLAYAVSFVALWYLILRFLDRRDWILRL